MALFRNRRAAGRKLAESLMDYAGRPDVVILGLPRGGVPVAYEVAQTLNVPMDIFLVRKLGLPGHEELAMGAIASGGVRVLNEDVVHTLDIPEDIIDTVAKRERQELERREQAYRGEREKVELKNKTVILVDDGLATGASMRAAVIGLAAQEPAQVIVAVPTAAVETCEAFEDTVDEIICAATPEPFFGVGFWYEDFTQTSDEEVKDSLQNAPKPAG